MEDASNYNPYEAPATPLPPSGLPPTIPGTPFVKAERSARFLAALADFGMYLVLVVMLVAGTAAFAPLKSSQAGAVGPILVIVGALGFLGLFITNLVLLHQDGQSLGKRWLKIRIVRSSGERAGLGRIFWLRMFVPGLITRIPLVGWVFALANPLCIFGEERRCLHDLMADTMVVNA
jgi:uncharacterized RDD family membrane protein YckC